MARKTGTRCEVALCLTGGGKGKGTKIERDHTSLGIDANPYIASPVNTMRVGALTMRPDGESQSRQKEHNMHSTAYAHQLKNGEWRYGCRSRVICCRIS